MGAAVNLALTLLMSLVPTLMFLGFWRLLVKLRDDDLVNRTLNEYHSGNHPERPAGNRHFALGEWAGAETAGVPRDPPDGDGPLVRCGSCGTDNAAYADFCRHCLEPLD